MIKSGFFHVFSYFSKTKYKYVGKNRVFYPISQKIHGFHAKYFKSSLGVILKFLKKITEATNNITMPCHFAHQSNPMTKNDKYEWFEFLLSRK